MALHVGFLPAYLTRDLNEAGYDDKAIAAMSPEEAFEAYCQWNGLIGWAGNLMFTVDILRKNDLTIDTRSDILLLSKSE